MGFVHVLAPRKKIAWEGDRQTDRQTDIHTTDIATLGFERDEGKVLIHRGIEGQGINTPFPFTLYYQGGGVLPLSRGQKMFSTRAKV